MIKCHLGPQPSVWITQVSLLSSVHTNRFHCSTDYFTNINFDCSIRMFLNDCFLEHSYIDLLLSLKIQ